VLALSTSLRPRTMRGGQTKSRPNKNRNTQIQRSCVSPFSRDHLSLLYAHCFFDPASSKANLSSSLRFIHQRLKRPPKIFKPTLHSLGLSWKCRRFRCRPQLVLKTCLRVFPTRRPDTANVSATSCDVGFFLSVSYVVSLPNCRHVVDRLRYIR